MVLFVGPAFRFQMSNACSLCTAHGTRIEELAASGSHLRRRNSLGTSARGCVRGRRETVRNRSASAVRCVINARRAPRTRALSARSNREVRRDSLLCCRHSCAISGGLVFAITPSRLENGGERENRAKFP